MSARGSDPGEQFAREAAPMIMPPEKGRKANPVLRAE